MKFLGIPDDTERKNSLFSFVFQFNRYNYIGLLCGTFAFNVVNTYKIIGLKILIQLISVKSNVFKNR